MHLCVLGRSSIIAVIPYILHVILMMPLLKMWIIEVLSKIILKLLTTVLTVLLNLVAIVMTVLVLVSIKKHVVAMQLHV